MKKEKKKKRSTVACLVVAASVEIGIGIMIVLKWEKIEMVGE